jgi:hypothetical protein
MGAYDLHGRYYQNSNDAMNAEMAQCAAIDADIAMREVNKMKKQYQQQQPSEQAYYDAINYCQMLEQRIAQLEDITKHLRPI